MPPGEIAYAVICFYLGVNLMTQLDVDAARVEALFDLANRLSPMVAPMYESS